MKEYYNTYEVAATFGINVKTVQRRIKEILSVEPNTNLIRKVGYGWKIHQLAVPRFAPPRRAVEYTALSFDTVGDYTSEDLQTIVRFVVGSMEGAFDFHYSIELKKKNGKPHLHAYLPTAHSTKFLKELRTYVEVGYEKTTIWDLDGWKSYISKEAAITTITKN